MSLKLNKERADLLCSIITLGFLKKNRQLENEGKHFTKILLESGDREKHNRLYNKFDDLQKTGVFEDVAFKSVGRDGKIGHPFIYAQRDVKENECSDGIEQIDSNMETIIEKLEAEINLKGYSYKGAYIGGVAGYDPISKKSEYRLLVPSMLRVYPIPDCIEADLNYNKDLESIFKTSKEATRHLDELARSFKQLEAKSDRGSIVVYSEQVHVTDDDMQSWERKLPKDHLFASVHGLVTSMLEAPPHKLDINNYNVELALGKDTSKVASCIPCAIFAASQNAPPTYTHLGRGDYWNFPTAQFSSEIPEDAAEDAKAARNVWELFVSDCYTSGLRSFGDFPRHLDEAGITFLNNNPQLISELFLNSLTFAGSFLDKIERVFDRIDAL